VTIDHGRVRVERVVTSGIFSLDGQDFEVENNVWVVGDDSEVLIIDPAHEAGPILGTVGDRQVRMIVCTHGHNDHINAADDVVRATGAPVAVHPDDRMLWDEVYPDRAPDFQIEDGHQFFIAGVRLQAMHTPGHSPGAVSLYAPDLGALFSGDTLFNGGPGATGRKYSDFGTIIDSIRDRLLVLPPETAVHTGHGDETTIGDEAPHLQEWIDRGH
jgi:glyoxylase-like metal-dependent hydrolase (beta-lactamase superfamily II)